MTTKTRIHNHPENGPRSRWLGTREGAAFVGSMLFAGIVITLLWATAGCSFAAEGEAIVGHPDHHRPDRPGGELLPQHDPSASSTDDPSTDGGSDVGGTSGGSTSPGSASTDPDSGSDSEGEAETSSDGGSSSTGEGAEYEPAHCDMTCPEGDALEPSEAQAGGTWPGCYCASPCESDDDCAPLEHCDPFFDRCTIACMGDADCMGIDPVPGAMSCTLWWESAESLTHFCTYWNEDAP